MGDKDVAITPEPSVDVQRGPFWTPKSTFGPFRPINALFWSILVGCGRAITYLEAILTRGNAFRVVF